MSDIDFANKILEVREELDAIKEKKTKLETRLEYLLEQIKEIGYNSVEEAKQDINKLEEKIIQLQNELEEGIEELEAIYD